MSRASVSRKVDRLLDRKGYGGERHQVRGGELMLYFSTSKVASEVRRLLVKSGVACEQCNARVTVFLDAEEEKVA